MDGSNTIIVGDGDVDALLPKGYEDIGVAITGEDSAAPNRYSLMSFGESDLGTDRFKYATRLAKATGVSVQQATDWIDSVYSVAAIIGDDKTRLDYEANRNNTSLKPNSEYDFSLDFPRCVPSGFFSPERWTQSNRHFRIPLLQAKTSYTSVKS